MTTETKAPALPLYLYAIGALLAAGVIAGGYFLRGPVFGAVLAGAGALWLLCASEQRFKYGLFFLAVYTPFEEFLLKFLPESVFHHVRLGPYAVLLAAFAFIWLRRLFDGRPIWKRTPIDIPIAVFLLASLVSMYLNRVPPFAMAIAYQPVLRFIVIVFFALMFVEFTRKDLRWLVALTLFAVGVESAIALSQSIVGLRAKEFFAPSGVEFSGYVAGEINQLVHEGPWNVFGTMLRYNTLGLFLGGFFAFALAFAWKDRRPRWIVVGLLALMAPALVVATARAGWLAAAVGSVIVLGIRVKPRIALSVAAIAVAFVAAAVFLFPSQIEFYGHDSANPFQRLLEPFSQEYRDISLRTYGRMFYLTTFPLELYRQDLFHFIIGYGPGTLGSKAQQMFGMFVLDDLGIQRGSQDYIIDVNWVYILGQSGIIGLLAFVATCVALAWRCYLGFHHETDRFVRAFYAAALGYIAATCVGAFFGPAFEMRPTSFYFWLFAAVAVKLTTQAKTEEGPTPEATDPTPTNNPA